MGGKAPRRGLITDAGLNNERPGGSVGHPRFVGFIGGAGTVSDDSGELIRSLKDKIADIKSELEEMDDDA
jgi:hypothetical protein